MRASLTTAGLFALFLSALLASIGCRSRVPQVLCADCNVLLISMDTLRADHLGCYGYDRPTSPNVDALAAKSVVFERAYSQSAWTRPAHASMLTGLHPVQHGIVAMTRNGGLDPSIPTLASTLAAKGYRTAAFTGGANMAPHFGFDNGFAVYRSPGRRFEDQLASVERWLSRADGRPWLLFLHAFDPHRPYKSLPPDRKALGLPAESPKRSRAHCKIDGDPNALAALIAEYDAAIHRGDRSLGNILRLLDARGELAKTVIVFTSDHGEEFLEHGRCFHIRSVYREVVHVPLIVHVPGVPARRVDQVVPASAAVTPTLLELVGHRDPDTPGPSLVAALAGGRAEIDEVISETSSRYIAARGHGHGHVRALTTDDDRLIHWISQGRREYFNIRDDPHEQRSIRSSPRIEVLATRLSSWLERHPPLDLATPTEELPVRLENQLRRLGYIE